MGKKINSEIPAFGQGTASASWRNTRPKKGPQSRRGGEKQGKRFRSSFWRKKWGLKSREKTKVWKKARGGNRSFKNVPERGGKSGYADEKKPIRSPMAVRGYKGGSKKKKQEKERSEKIAGRVKGGGAQKRHVKVRQRSPYRLMHKGRVCWPGKNRGKGPLEKVGGQKRVIRLRSSHPTEKTRPFD